jgi:hypothetical protein
MPCRLRQIKEELNAPYYMDLIFDFFRFCLLLYEREYVLELLLAACLETRRVVKGKVWVVLE